MVGGCVEDKRLGSSNTVAGLVSLVSNEESKTHRRKKWKRSVMSRKDTLPPKKAPRARLTSGVEVYLSS